MEFFYTIAVAFRMRGYKSRQHAVKEMELNFVRERNRAVAIALECRQREENARVGR